MYSTIDFNYFFVKGLKIPLKKGLELGDGGCISYVDEKTCISWAVGEYVKPKQYYIPNPTFVDNQIQLSLWDLTGNPVSIDLNYVFTLKQNYAQRIANHSFNHPIRVGVDFVKTK
jgi:hypothetical protein